MISDNRKVSGDAARFHIVLCSRKGRFPPQGRGAFFSGKEPAPHPGRKTPRRFDFALDPQRHKGRGSRPPPLETNPQRPGQQPESTVTARFPALMGRQSCRFLESGPLYPPLAALSSLSPIPPLETPPRARRGSGSGKKSMGCPICTPLCSAPTGAGDAVLGRTDIAQPAGDFRILSAVRDGQPPFWVS